MVKKIRRSSHGGLNPHQPLPEYATTSRCIFATLVPSALATVACVARSFCDGHGPMSTETPQSVVCTFSYNNNYYYYFFAPSVV